jgi:hypothetical protein
MGAPGVGADAIAAVVVIAGACGTAGSYAGADTAVWAVVAEIAIDPSGGPATVAGATAGAGVTTGATGAGVIAVAAAASTGMGAFVSILL